MSDGHNILTSVQDGVGSIFFVRPLQTFRTSYRNSIVAIGPTASLDGINKVIISVVLEPVLAFQSLMFIITYQAEKQVS